MTTSTEQKVNASSTLQVMICTYGREGLERVAAASHPKVKGVEYLVCCQIEGNHVLPEKLEREDFRVIRSSTRGLSVNRNIALSHATAPLLLLSDDDADYSEQGLLDVMESFKKNPDADIIAFRYASSLSKKFYPEEVVSLSQCPKGYYISSIEIAMRRKSVQGAIWFNEDFGVGATFPSGEEDIFIRECLDRGLNGIYIPKTIVSHDGTTTSGRNLMLPSRPQTKGAVFLRLYPRQWPLRMIAHTLREFPLWRKGLVPSPASYCINWIKGVLLARKKNVFPTPDYTSKYLCHE